MKSEIFLPGDICSICAEFLLNYPICSFRKSGIPKMENPINCAKAKEKAFAITAPAKSSGVATKKFYKLSAPITLDFLSTSISAIGVRNGILKSNMR